MFLPLPVMKLLFCGVPSVWNSYVTTRYSYWCRNTSKADLRFSLFEFLLIVSFVCLWSVVHAWAVPAFFQHLAQGCWFGCFSAMSTLSFSVALAAKCSCSKHSPNCTLHPVLAFVQVSHKAANTLLKTPAPGNFTNTNCEYSPLRNLFLQHLISLTI